MTTCSCPPGSRCFHAGRNSSEIPNSPEIPVGPGVRLTDEQVRAVGQGVLSHTWLQPMAAELLALRAALADRDEVYQRAEALDRRVSELEAETDGQAKAIAEVLRERDAAERVDLDRLEAQRKPLGYGVVVEGADGVGGLWVQTSPLLTEADAVDRAQFYGYQRARAVAMIEVGR